MYLYAKDEFTLLDDFEEVKTGLVWLAEQFLPVGVTYQVWYDPDVARAYGRLKKMTLRSLRPSETTDHGRPWCVEEYRPPHWRAAIGLYHVLTRVATGEPPPLPDAWRRRKQLRYEYAQKERRAIETARKETPCT